MYIRVQLQVVSNKHYSYDLFGTKMIVHKISTNTVSVSFLYSFVWTASTFYLSGKKTGMFGVIDNRKSHGVHTSNW